MAAKPQRDVEALFAPLCLLVVVGLVLGPFYDKDFLQGMATVLPWWIPPLLAYAGLLLLFAAADFFWWWAWLDIRRHPEKWRSAV